MEILNKDEEKHSKAETNNVMGYQLTTGVLYKTAMIRGKEKDLWVVPKVMRKSIVVWYHDLSGHFSVDRSVDNILERLYFAGLRRYVHYHIRCCPECALTKVPRGKQQGELNPILPGKRLFEIINIDHIEPFVKSTRGNNYILVMIDNLTKFVKLYPVHSCGTKEVVNSLESFILMYENPRRIISDRATALTSRDFVEFYATGGIAQTLTSVRHLQANGQVERVNNTLVPVLQANMKNDRTWDQQILKVESQLNNAFNSTIGDTPFRVLYEYNPSYTDGILSSVTSKEQWDNVERLPEKVRERITAEHLKWKERYDARHAKPIRYHQGDRVFIKCVPESTGESTKLQAIKGGPLIVSKVLPNDTYRIAAIRSEAGRHFVTTVHVSKIKDYHLPEEDQNQNQRDEERDQEETEETKQGQLESVPQEENEETIETQQEDKDREIKRQPRRKKTPAWSQDYIM